MPSYRGCRQRGIRALQPGSRHQPLLFRDGAGARIDFRRRERSVQALRAIFAEKWASRSACQNLWRKLCARGRPRRVSPAVLKMMPQTAMEQLAARFNRCSLRNDAEHVANLAADLGEEGLQYLRSTVRGGPVAEAVEMVGLLCKLDRASDAEVFLPARMKEFPRNVAGSRHASNFRQRLTRTLPHLARDCWITSIRW